MPDEVSDIPEITEERLIRPFVETAESVRGFVNGIPGWKRWNPLAYELVCRHLMDIPVNQPGVDIGPMDLIEIRQAIEFAAKVAGRAPHHLQDATFRAVLGHLLYRVVDNAKTADEAP